MDLFELMGRIAVSGTEEASAAIESVADSAEEGAERICSAFDRIGNRALSYGIEISLTDIPQEENGFLEGIAQRVREVTSLGEGQNRKSLLSDSMESILRKFSGLEPVEIYERTETLTDENYSNTNREESFSESKSLAHRVSELIEKNANLNREESFSDIHRMLTDVNRTESLSENRNTAESISKIIRSFADVRRKESFSDIHRMLTDVNRTENLSESRNTAESISKIIRSFADVHRKESFSESYSKFSSENLDEKYLESRSFSERLNRNNDRFMSVKRDESFSEEVSTTKNITEIALLSDSITDIAEKINSLFTEDFQHEIISSEDISEQIKSADRVIDRDMAKLSDTQLSHLDRLYGKSLDRWGKIGMTSATGVDRMAYGVLSRMPFVVSACDRVAQGSAQALSVDGSASGRYLMESFGNGISQKAYEVYNAVSGIAQNISAIMSGITFSGISAEASVEAVSIPEYATGGIVTREHIARVGENGAEAIIPLEHNTEWIDKVASRMSGNTSNSAVVAKLDELNSNIKNLRIYLDGKALVGGIANEMDRKLGSVARLKGRG